MGLSKSGNTQDPHQIPLHRNSPSFASIACLSPHLWENSQKDVADWITSVRCSLWNHHWDLDYWHCNKPFLVHMVTSHGQQVGVSGVWRVEKLLQGRFLSEKAETRDDCKVHSSASLGPLLCQSQMNTQMLYCLKLLASDYGLLLASSI